MTRRTFPWILSLCAGLFAATFPSSLLADGAVKLMQLPEQEGRVRLALDPAVGTAWDRIHIARLVARSSQNQRSLSSLSPGKHLDLDLEPGCSMILADVGSRFTRDAATGNAAEHPPMATHATKIATCRHAKSPRAALDERLAIADMMTSKTGSQIEIRPLRSPSMVPPGSDLPVIVYFESLAQKGVPVEAVGPDGKKQTATTDGVGAAHFTISKSGPWVVRFSTEKNDLKWVAELRFEVAPQTFWDTLPPLVPNGAAQAAATKKTKMATPEWTELGPAPISFGAARNTGRASSIVAVPGRPNRYYVGAASGGVWETVNGGVSWKSLNESLPILSIGALAVDPKNDRVIYAGSGESNNAYHSIYGLGLYRTFNRGRTWKVLAPGVFSGRTFSRLVVSPVDNRVIWAAVARAGGTFGGFEGARQHPQAKGRMGVFRSRDRGETWEHLRAPNGLANFVASDLDLDPIDPNRVYVSMGDAWGRTLNGVYRSTDGGENFQGVLTSQTTQRNFGRVTLAISPSNPDRLYALVTNPADRSTTGGFSPGGASVLGLYRSDDGGDSWILSVPTNFMAGQGSYNSTAVVDPNDPDTVYVGGVQLLRSTNAGQTFTDVTPVHVDHHDMTFDAAGRLVVANDGGVNRSSDRGQSWTALNEGLGIVQIYPGLALHPTNPNVILAGMQDNGTNLRLGGSKVWTLVFGGDGGYNAIDPNNSNIMFVEFQGTGNLFRSTNGGFNFNASATGISTNDRSCFLPPFVFDPANSNRMLYATQRVYESTDGGLSWAPISGDLTRGAPWAIHSLVIAPSNSNVVYALTNDGRALVSSNGGSTWDLVLQNVAGWPRVTRQIAVDPARPSQAFIADMGFGGRKLSATLNRGRTWREIGGGLPDVPINTVAVHRAGNQRHIFVGTDAGVFISSNFGSTWQPYGKLPRAPIMDLVVDVNFDRLVAATLGRGAWSIDLP